MDNQTKIYFKNYLPMVFIILACFFLFIALSTIIKRKPIFISAKWLYAAVCMGFLPSILNVFMFSHSSETVNKFQIINMIIIFLMLLFMWFQMKGYFAFGISEEYFRKSLLSSVDNLGYTIDETMSKILIKETSDELQIVIQGWVGTAQLKPAKQNSKKISKEIFCEMKNYFSLTGGEMNFVTSYIYLILGIIMIVFGYFLSNVYTL